MKWVGICVLTVPHHSEHFSLVGQQKGLYFSESGR